PARGRGRARAPRNDHRRAQRSHAIRRDRPRVPRSRRLRVRRSEDATRGILRGRGRGRGSPQARADRAARARVARAPRRARGALAGRRSCSHYRPVGHAGRISRSHSLEASAMATIALPLRRGSLARVGTGVPLVVGMVGTLASWLGSGWDVSWHRIFGRDTFWTTPHLFIYVGVSLWGIAALFATVTAMAGRPIRGRALVVGRLRAELGIGLIGIGALITILAAPFDNAWHAAFGRDVDIWAPPHVFGLAGGGIGLAGYGILAGSGWRPPAFPALVIVGAVAIDLLRARGGKWAQPLVLGFAFSGVFVIAELLRMTFFGPPAPTAVIGGTEQLSR